MKCTKCGGDTYIINTRCPEKYGFGEANFSCVVQGEALLKRHFPSAYRDQESNWKARTRKCKECGHKDYTVEFPIRILKRILSERERE